MSTPAQVRANASNLDVSTQALEQLADLRGPDWRARLAGVLGEVSVVWPQRSSWACLSNDTLIVVSASGRCVVAVRPDWWCPDQLRSTLAQDCFVVSADVETRWHKEHGDDLWNEVLSAAAARLASSGEFGFGPGRVSISSGRLGLWVKGRQRADCDRWPPAPARPPDA